VHIDLQTYTCVYCRPISLIAVECYRRREVHTRFDL